jgi:hypothetical protein
LYTGEKIGVMAAAVLVVVVLLVVVELMSVVGRRDTGIGG